MLVIALFIFLYYAGKFFKEAYDKDEERIHDKEMAERGYSIVVIVDPIYGPQKSYFKSQEDLQKIIDKL